MNSQVFQKVQPNIDNNLQLREPQLEGYSAIQKYYDETNKERESSIVLPVGCGKSGLITLAPFATKSKRTLVIAPNNSIRSELGNNFDPNHQKFFYSRFSVLQQQPYPEPTVISDQRINQSLLDTSDVVVTNIHQLQGKDNRWLVSLPDDYFDLILVDEAHHNVATSWLEVNKKFANARIVNFSATPRRADGQKMSGKVIYQFPVSKAIDKGYVKHLKAWVLNPESLKYVNKDTGTEYELSLEEIRKKSQNDSRFRRSVVLSDETLNTIVDASIRALEEIRDKSGDRRHKIIAAALDYDHCHAIVAAYSARGLKADYVHSERKDVSKANEKVKEKLQNNELDVIVQVNMLGEGFDHPHLSVAAVFKTFSSLSPFVQFVGRAMRTVAGAQENTGIVVFHAGSNIARLWEDFQEFSQADQEFFDELLPIEELDFSGETGIIEREPTPEGVKTNPIVISEQKIVHLSEIPLLQDPEVVKLLQQLKDKGVTEDIVIQSNILKPLVVTKQKRWKADLVLIDSQVKNASGKILAKRGVSPEGHDLDHKHIGRTNFQIIKGKIDDEINKLAGIKKNSRKDLTPDQVSLIKKNLQNICTQVENSTFVNGKN